MSNGQLKKFWINWCFQSKAEAFSALGFCVRVSLDTCKNSTCVDTNNDIQHIDKW